MTSGVAGFSSCLIWNFHKVLEILSLSGPTQARDLVELTSHDSPSTYREYVAGLIAGGEISLDGNLIVGDEDGQIAFHTDVQGGTKRSGFIVMPMAVGGALFFAAIAIGFEASYPFDSKIGMSGSLMVSGKPLLLTAQSAGMGDLTGHEYDDTVEGSVLTFTPAGIDEGVYAYVAGEVDEATDGVKLVITADGQIVYAQGVLEETTVETDTILLGDKGTTTDILIIVHEGTAAIPTKAPRLYILSVPRAAAA